jgi:hypothetical protein
MKDPQELLDKIVDVVLKYKPPKKKKKGHKKQKKRDKWNKKHARSAAKR